MQFNHGAITSKVQIWPDVKIIETQGNNSQTDEKNKTLSYNDVQHQLMSFYIASKIC